jgi:hypothetical protein
MMMGRNRSKLTAKVALLAAVAICIASCSSSAPQAPGMPDVSSMQLAPAPAGSCQIDAVKMCQVVGGSGPPPPTQPSTTMSTYGPPNLPDSYDFQIPAGQDIKLMCYYDPQHTSVYRADATPDSALTGNSVAYMKQRGFCANK